MLYSEDINKKVKIQNKIQFEEKNGKDYLKERINYELVNKYNPDLSANIHKYMDEELIKEKKKALFKKLKNNLLSSKNNINLHEKKIVYRIKKRKKEEIDKNESKLNREKNEIYHNIQKDVNQFPEIKMKMREEYRKLLLIKLYGFYIGNIINKKIFSNYKI